MSSPIDLTTSDDEILSSQPRAKGKRKIIDLSGCDETPTKRGQPPSMSSSRPSSSKYSREAHFPAHKDEYHTPSKSSNNARSRHAGHSTSSFSSPIEKHRGNSSLSSPATFKDSEDEPDEAFEFEEITRIKFEQDAHRGVAKKPPAGYKIVNSAHMLGVSLKAGTNVELSDGEFLRIVYIFRNMGESRDSVDAYILRGMLLRRTSSRNPATGGMFPATMNELVAIISIPMDDHRPTLEAGLQDRALSEVTCIREIRFTNAASRFVDADYADFSFREDDDQTRWYMVDPIQNKLVHNRPVILAEAHLVCRWKFVEYYCPDMKSNSHACLMLEPDEADADYRLTNAQLIRRYFRRTRGTFDGAANKNTAIKGDLADLFCGSGGASEAARLAGVHVAVAVDKKECAFWSPVHTVAGRNDEANESAAFMVNAAAKKLGCRIMIFEQTPGFVRIKKHRPQWHAFIQQFTSMGFSVKWRTIKAADHGGPNARLRLWLYATCPGQNMPEDIQPTHGPIGSGLIPYVTVRQALANIPAGATLHDPEAQAEKFRLTGKPSLPLAEWDKPLKHIIPTAGPQALHPDGRPFTIREAMCLQGFPFHYQLIVAHYASLKEALRFTDEELAAHKDGIMEEIQAHRHEIVDLDD
uniref:DNA (cytosine-5-)-methyltransferase n=1 Tax=Ramularia collo-cygni TaxID=112498 RepID=A0A2D3UP17_9PEZI